MHLCYAGVQEKVYQENIQVAISGHRYNNLLLDVALDFLDCVPHFS